ncbi:MAG: SprB repeat-containing protein [Lewinellaceae bacterium]|nr:SprB repeat-containing protein [Lewinellaceae bacterium]
MGPTGLKAGETDISEPAGCANANQSNFPAPCSWKRARPMPSASIIYINRKRIFGRVAAQALWGPEAAFVTLPPNPAIVLARPSNSMMHPRLSWGRSSVTRYFPIGFIPSTATDPAGPVQHEVTYSTAGTKSIALVVETNLGCIVTTVQTVNIGTCCDDFNAMQVVEDLTHPDCFGDSDGAIDLTVTSATPTAYQWTTGQTLQDIAMLSAGSYTVTITNEATCDTVLSYEITSPRLIEGNPLITKPTCDGGQDGAILLQTTGGVPPLRLAGRERICHQQLIDKHPGGAVFRDHSRCQRL